jgi:hypothetical protein
MQVLVIDHDTFSRPVEVVILSVAQRPEECGKSASAEQERKRYQKN